MTKFNIVRNFVLIVGAVVALTSCSKQDMEYDCGCWKTRTVNRNGTLVSYERIEHQKDVCMEAELSYRREIRNGHDTTITREFVECTITYKK